MLVVTPKKYNNLNCNDTRRSYQNIIDMLLDLREAHPLITIKEMNIYAAGVVQGRTKQNSKRRKKI